MNSPTTQQELETFITNGIEERLDLEYKRADSLKKSDGAKKEITKDVSSFANSAGGILIYGIAEFAESEKTHLPERLDPVDRTLVTREWLDQVIGNIRPRLDVTITPIDLDTGESHCAYVVKIPKGATAHQAADCRYYKRFNFRAEMMPDHEIRDVMSRGEHPIILPQFRIRLGKVYYASSGFTSGQRQRKKSPRPYFDVSVKNTGVRMAQYVTLWFKLPGSPLIDLPHNCTQTSDVFENEDGFQVYCVSNRQRDITGWAYVLDNSVPKYSEPYFHPVLPTLDMDLGSIEVKADSFVDFWESTSSFEWRLQSDNAPSISGNLLMSELLHIDEYHEDEN